eukprot:gnl/MRDRNA2_/MRDRNA2_99748_c0_seq1.p1 gnl/MRDRNA2_/MRDRNA2_99748_c0~~gnl/MRDRNA2_/MRDRNA2_99748_c0_seq1.p1  ORF type:complete len:140 (+),score=34.53 gnl/MRDRNA2_/MRDRNA2_99748_c0_seq1:120-539(+)
MTKQTVSASPITSKAKVLKNAKPKGKKDSAEPTARKALEQCWYSLMRQELPAAARSEGGWPIHFDHCFMRVALDNYFGKCWYEVLDKQKGAVKCMSDSQLSGAIKVAQKMLHGGKERVVKMNVESLRFRGKKGPGRATN